MASYEETTRVEESARAEPAKTSCRHAAGENQRESAWNACEPAILLRVRVKGEGEGEGRG